MRVVQINLGNFGSTGNIANALREEGIREGLTVYNCYPFSPSNRVKSYNDIIIGSRIDRTIHVALGRLTGFDGFFSNVATVNLLRKIDKIDPDLIHLHNLHNCYINIPKLFEFIRRKKKPVIWTLHDCWSFTGRCPHFVLSKCGRWKVGCSNCPYPKDQYPKSLIDTSAIMWAAKRKIFTNIANMKLVTPSRWLANLVSQSFLCEYPVTIIHNGVDLGIYEPLESKFRESYGIGKNEIMLLGVAFGWGYRKGLDVFVELASRLPQNYRIVLVGVDDSTKQKLPERIIPIERTKDQRQLAEIYSSADLFINPTREEVLGMVNLESLACGTPVITFDSGGSPECIDETCGRVVPCNDITALIKEIETICANSIFSSASCISRAQNFDKRKFGIAYVSLYKEMIGRV